ncbi:MAG: PH domain-containing protein [Gammaproteobacteria bacterium]|nr:PH domain-containing protein [Gammaproteobacteria bacterium]
MSQNNEQTVWRARSSQVVNLGTYFLCLLTAWLIIPIVVAVYQWLQVRCRVYELTTQRFRITRGILSKHIDELELYRVKDVTLHRPFVQRLFSLGTVVLDTSDHSTPQVVIPAVADIEWLRDQIRQCVESRRDSKGVKEVDFA